MWSTRALILLVIASLCADYYEVASFSLTILPRHVRASPRDNVTVMCRANAEFSDCQFTWWDVDDEVAGPIFHFSQGPNSSFAYLTNATQMNYRLAGYRYEGEGLHRGECGIQLYGVLLRYRMLACRVRTLGQGWNYAAMTICAEAKEPAELSFAPTEPVVLLGGSLTFLCLSSSPLATCNFRFRGIDPIRLTNSELLPNTQKNTTLSQNSMNRRNETGRPAQWTTYGDGLQQKQCGVRLSQIGEESNGLVFFDAETLSGGYDRRVFFLTVAKPPAEVKLSIFTEVVDGITHHKATCNVSESRPVANITWYLGDQIIRQNKMDDSEDDNSWRWNHGLHSILQKWTVKMGPEDAGKILKCRVDHIAMGQPLIGLAPLNVVGRNSTTPRIDDSFSAATTCPALSSGQGISLRCLTRGKQVSCSSPMVIGTVARVDQNCPRGYSLSSNSQYRSINCLPSGVWARPVPSCIAVTSSPASSKCPALYNTAYVSLECNSRGKPVFCTRPMDISTVATARCRDGYELPEEGSYRNITCTRSGVWDKHLPTCVIAVPQRCPTLQFSDDVSVECTHRDRRISCVGPMEVGTVAKTTPRCTGLHTLPDGAQYLLITCLSTGTWDKPVPTCKPAAAVAPGCGTSTRADGKPLMASGVPVVAGEVPWHVGIYRLYNNDVYEQVCSGTLIAPKTIITAASCFWKSHSSHGTPIDVQKLKVGAGKLRREWNHDDEHIQRRDVSSVLATELYIGMDTNYQLDIALLKVTEAFEINNYVNVACFHMDPSMAKQERYITGKVGNVPGWGFPEEDSPGSHLKTVTMPHIPHSTCYNLLAPEVQRFMTTDKFCAGSTNDYEGYTVCESDSGAGIVFYSEAESKYYLYGVASVALKPKTNREVCYPSHIASFTMTSVVYDWLRGKIE